MNRLFAKIHLVLAVALACTNGLAAQSAAPARVAFPPEPAAWVVAVSPIKRSGKARESAPQENQEPRPEQEQQKVWILKSIEVTRTGDLTRSRLKWSNGRTSEVWWVDDPKAMLAEKPDGSAVEIDALLVGASPLLPDASMFPWVSDKSYLGTRSYDGKKCHYYASQVQAPGEAPAWVTGDAPTKTLHEAWIDQETGLPVALSDGQNSYVFTFLPAPTSPLVLPPRFQAELTRARNSAPNPKYLGQPRSWQRKK